LDATVVYPFVKIIHIVENLDKGAVETMLINLFIECKKSRPDWQWTFFCILGREGRLDEKVRSVGGEIIYSPVTVSDKVAFLSNLRKVLKEGKYDIIHSHHDFLSGFYLLASAGIKYRKRILHVHNTDRSLPVGNRVVHKLLLKPFHTLALHFSDTIVGVSRFALSEFLGNRIGRRLHKVVLYHGIDFNQFEKHPDLNAFKVNFDIPADAKVGLFVGRLNTLKNPEFFVDVLKYIIESSIDFYALFIGTGNMESVVREKAKQYGIEDHIRILGWREDIPMVMTSCDVFVFPRKEFPKEALGLVVIEAQAAGLPMFITHGIVEDAIVINELAHFNDLSDPSLWAQQISEVLNHPLPLTKEAALERMKESPFELGKAAKNLVDLYEC
jgi:glycosyltransferase involved in cell wall biosynthesis